MMISVLKSKLAYATITQTELYYVGSMTIDRGWMDKTGLIENEQVQVVNLNNGKRLETYVIAGERGSRTIGLNGPAARLGEVGDELFILAYVWINPHQETCEPKVYHCQQRGVN